MSQSNFKKPEGKSINDIAHFTAPIGPHQRIHEGNMYEACIYASALADNANLSILVRVGANLEAHLLSRIAAGGDVEFEVWETPTFVNPGTALDEINLNREIDPRPIATTTTFFNASVTTTGALIHHDLIPGGMAGIAQGGSSARGAEWNLAKGGDYLLRAHNRRGANKIVVLGIIWYEHE